MNVELTARNYQPSNRVREHVEDRADKFLKYVADLPRVRYTITTEGVGTSCEINLHALGKDFHSKGEHEDPLVAVDQASSTMEEQLRRAKAKRTDRKPRGGGKGMTSAAALEAQLQQGAEDGQEDD